MAAPHTKWEHGRLSVRFPLRRGADLSAVLAEVAAQLGGGGGRKGPASPGATEGGVEGAGCPALEGEVVTKACARTPCQEEIACSSSPRHLIRFQLRALQHLFAEHISSNALFSVSRDSIGYCKTFSVNGVVRGHAMCISSGAEGLLACVYTLPMRSGTPVPSSSRELCNAEWAR